MPERHELFHAPLDEMSMILYRVRYVENGGPLFGRPFDGLNSNPTYDTIMTVDSCQAFPAGPNQVRLRCFLCFQSKLTLRFF